mmetsp:Transcript_45713/g.129311  ORF Transcript_45713/g.129311 Transcript_45713/m.129311 type:complete len:664 (+) Transcript_45713:62-2053(+)
MNGWEKLSAGVRTTTYTCDAHKVRILNLIGVDEVYSYSVLSKHRTSWTLAQRVCIVASTSAMLLTGGLAVASHHLRTGHHSVPGGMIEEEKSDQQLQCASAGEDCRSARCCKDVGMKCYEKDRYYAGCRMGCAPGSPEPGATGSHREDPWSCSPLRCSRAGEDCRKTQCCEAPHMKCYEKDEFYAGCRPNCSAGEPELGASGPHRHDKWTCKKPIHSCACLRSCHGNGRCHAFPEVDYIYLPESDLDKNRSTRIAEEFDVYACGRTLRKVPGVNPELWPRGGQYDKVKFYGHQLPQVGGAMGPWWQVRNLAYAEINSEGQSTWMLRGLKHHAGCGLSHFTTWMDAKHRGLKAMTIAESDGFPSWWFHDMAGGRTSEFDSVVLALLEEAPPDWQIIFLDKGKRGAQPDRGPVKRMMRECWQSPYEIYKWTGEGVAGLALYMVSSGFLKQVPTMIHDYGFDMVDAYINKLCSDKGSLKCYSVKAASLEPAHVPGKDHTDGEPEEKTSTDLKDRGTAAGHWQHKEMFMEHADAQEDHEDGAAGACSHVCKLGGSSATCRHRLQYIVNYSVSGNRYRCVSTQRQVLRECPVCRKCVFATAGCSRSPREPIYKDNIVVKRGQTNSSQLQSRQGVCACLFAEQHKSECVFWRGVDFQALPGTAESPYLC